MSFIGDFIGDITGANDAADAAAAASRTQATSAQQGIAEQRRQFDTLVELMSPYVGAGVKGLEGQQALLGLGGAEAQQAAINQLEQSPLYQSLARQGEEAMLQQASATGGLRGGNIQGALAQYRPQLLNQQIQQQLGNLGGLSGLGQAAAAGQAAAGQAMGSNVSNLLQQQGAAIAGGQLAQGQATQQGFGNLLGLGGVVSGFF